MAKICFIGAGSTVFAKNVLGDCMHVESLRGAQIALLDVDPVRLADSERMVNNLNRTLNSGMTVEAFLAADADKALAGA